MSETATTTRLDNAGRFDEFVCTDASAVHFEMLSSGTLWCGIDLADGTRHVLTVRADRGRLVVGCEMDA